ncbi:uncharacterized protein LOC120346271 [Styela clava]
MSLKPSGKVEAPKGKGKPGQAQDKNIGILLFVLDGIIIVAAIFLVMGRKTCPDQIERSNSQQSADYDYSSVGNVDLQNYGHESPTFNRFKPSTYGSSSYGSSGSSYSSGWGFISSLIGGSPWPGDFGSSSGSSYGSPTTSYESTYGSAYSPGSSISSSGSAYASSHTPGSSYYSSGSPYESSFGYGSSSSGSGSYYESSSGYGSTTSYGSSYGSNYGSGSSSSSSGSPYGSSYGSGSSSSGSASPYESSYGSGSTYSGSESLYGSSYGSGSSSSGSGSSYGSSYGPSSSTSGSGSPYGSNYGSGSLSSSSGSSYGANYGPGSSTSGSGSSSSSSGTSYGSSYVSGSSSSGSGSNYVSGSSSSSGSGSTYVSGSSSPGSGSNYGSTYVSGSSSSGSGSYYGSSYGSGSSTSGSGSYYGSSYGPGSSYGSSYGSGSSTNKPSVYGSGSTTGASLSGYGSSLESISVNKPSGSGSPSISSSWNNIPASPDEEVAPSPIAAINAGNAITTEEQGTPISDANYPFKDLVDMISEDTIVNTNFKCGVPKFKPNLKVGRIVGGGEAVKHSWPWVVALMTYRIYAGKEIYSSSCGATIVSPKHIISALHCFNDKLREDDEEKIKGDPDKYIRLFIGKHDQNHILGEKYEIAKVRWHPKGVTEPYIIYDLVIITTKTEIKFSDKVQPACLPKYQAEREHESWCWAVGWGSTKGTGSKDELKQVRLQIGNAEACSHILNYEESFLKKEIAVCAGKIKGRDTCQGDSGGPLTCDDNGKATLYGATSWGFGCAKGIYGVYASVSFALEWICCFMANIPGCRGVSCNPNPE